jgi:PAS domain S-box-containing protein
MATGLTATIILVVVVAFSVISGRNKSIEAAKVEYYQKALLLSENLRTTIDNSFSLLQIQNRIFLALEESGEFDKTKVMNIIEANLLANNEYVGMSALFEPKIACKADTAYNHLMEKGMFLPYLYYNKSGKIMDEILIDYDVEGKGDYYLIPKRTKKPLLTEPFYYPVNGENLLMITLAEPVLKGGEIIAVTTIDYDLEFIQLISEHLAKNINAGNAIVAVISNKGVVLGNSSDNSMINHSFRKGSPNEKDSKNGDIYFNKENLVINLPVVFSNTDTPWRVHVSVPRKDILAEANRQTWILIITGILLTSLAITIIYFLVGTLIKPLFKLVENTKKISEGDLSVEIKSIQNDEIGILTDSFNIMVVRIRNMVDSLQNSIREVEEKSTELADKEEKFRLLFEYASDAILFMDNTGAIFDANRAACKAFGLSKETIIGINPGELSPKFQSEGTLSIEKAKVYIESALEGETQQFEWIHQNSNGDNFDAAIGITKIELSGQTYLQSMFRDITEKKRRDKELDMHRNHLEQLVNEKTRDLEKAYKEVQVANKELNSKNNIINEKNQQLLSTLRDLKETQAQLLHADKMASIGVLTSGVAHEINNPLNFIQGAYEGMRLLYKDNMLLESHLKMERFLEALKLGVERATSIVNGLNQFNHKSKSYNEDADIHAIIDNCLIMLRNKTKYDIEIQKIYSTETLMTKGNVGNLHQVFLNILTNAVQSIEKTGTLKIKTDLKNDIIQIEIHDTGCGISNENIENITNPFFTTKNPGEGTGLGLSITYNIVKEHKGTLNFESEEGVGTTVFISLPMVS